MSITRFNVAVFIIFWYAHLNVATFTRPHEVSSFSCHHHTQIELKQSNDCC